MDFRMDVQTQLQKAIAAHQAGDLETAGPIYKAQHVAFNSGRIWFDTNGQPEVARAMGTFSVTRGTNSLLDKLNTMGPGQ